jgi:hypothetical protein
MKKRLSLLMASLACLSASAQVVQAYDAQVVHGTYTPITDGVVVASTVEGIDFGKGVYSGDGTEHTSAFTGQGFPIGFDFKYDNKMMNQFVIGARGYIILGKDSVKASVPSSTYSLFTSSDDNDLLGMIYRSEVGRIASTEVSYKTVGEAPNRELIVQFKDLQMCVDGWKATEVRDTVGLQIHLYEATGNVELVFNGFEPSATTASDFNYDDALKIGIRGEVGDLLIKSGSFDSDVFVVKDDNIRWKSSQYPADGLTYLFAAPEDCAAPATQPADLSYTTSTNGVEGKFVPTAAADHYLVLINKAAELSAAPEGGKIYAVGDSIGDARVIAYGVDTTFSCKDILEGASTYYVHVLGVNAFCFYGPKYNTVSPLTSAIVTKPLPPAGFDFTANDSTSITFNVKGNAAGDDVLVAYTTEPKLNIWGQTLAGGSFGTPSGSYEVGSTIEGGGTVAYVGKSKDGIVATDLVPGMTQYFKAWSRNAAGEYSTTSIEAVGSSAGVLPWSPDFSKMAGYEAPEGWMSEGGWTVQDEKGDGVQNMLQAISDGSTAMWFETPDLYLTEGANRLKLDMLMYVWGRFSNTPYSLRETDTVAVSVTTNGVDYTPVATYTMGELEFASGSEYTTLRIPFTEAAGQKARLRLYMRIAGTPRIQVKNIVVEEKKACDYPIDVTVADSTIAGSEAVVTWTPQTDEQSWEVRYKKTEDEEWGTPVVVREKKCVLTGLEGLTSYDVQVRGRASVSRLSDWTETVTFTSGLAIPFDLAFGSLTALPGAWSIVNGAMDSTKVENEAWQFSYRMLGSSMSYTPSDETAVNDWLITPKVDLGTDENAKYNVTFSIMATSDASAESDGTLQIVALKDGKTASASDVLYTVKTSELPAAYETKDYTAAVKGGAGKVNLGLYTHSTVGGMPMMRLTNLGVNYSCVNDIEAKIDSVGENAVNLSWESGAEEWYVFVREAGETSRNFTTVTKPELALTELKRHTSYEIGLTKACAPGDTAEVKIVEVTTLGDPCVMPTDIKVTPSKYSAKVEWTGNAYAYNVRYRGKGQTEWTTEQVYEPSIVIGELDCATEYEYALQSQGSKSASDTSAFTPVASFTTLAETCVAPTNVTVTPSFDKAEISFESEADKFEVGYRKTTDDAWTVVEKASTSADNKHTITIDGLVAETTYKVRLRSICAEGDSSLWTASAEFTTPAEPECVTPTDLTVSDITNNSAVLSWTGDNSNLSWNLRYRASSVTEWTEQSAISTTSYTLNELQANTAYIWRVQAVCEAERTSKWASQNKFTTAAATAIDNIGIGSVDVFMKGNVLNVINPEGGMIRSITVYGADGRTIAASNVNTVENVFMRIAANGPVIIKVVGQKQTKTLRTVVNGL